MKKSILAICVYATLLCSCKLESDKSFAVQKGKEVTEDITFQLEQIPAELETGEGKKTIDKQTLGLPSDFINRDFLSNSVGYKDKLDYLVGMVVKKEKVNGVEKYSVALDFKKDSSRVSARVPAQGILIEKKYDQKTGAGIQYLIASAEMERNAAFQVLIADVSEITIDDSAINKVALYNTYMNDPEIEQYYVVRAAVTTGILYKRFTKMSAKSDFSAAAIKVGAQYYSESSDLKQDWKIGMQLTPVKEFLKGFVPTNQTNS